MQKLHSLIHSELHRKSVRLNQLTKLVRGILPQELRQHVDVANLRNNKLVLMTTSPVWATRLRQYSPDVEHMLSNFPDLEIHGLTIKCSPRIPASNQTCPAPLQMSQEAARVIAQTANYIAHRPLVDALRQLARRAGGKPQAK